MQLERMAWNAMNGHNDVDSEGSFVAVWRGPGKGTWSGSGVANPRAAPNCQAGLRPLHSTSVVVPPDEPCPARREPRGYMIFSVLAAVPRARQGATGLAGPCGSTGADRGAV